MDPIARQTALAAAGAAGEASYVDDVFSTFLYEGTNSTLNIANGIDLSNEGGLVWIKRRSDSSNHCLWDTERGVQKGLSTNNNSSVSDATGYGAFGLTAFNSDGFTLGSSWMGENSSGDYTSWTFRKAPGFFDVVTYTGNATAGRTVAHNLGSEPGFIMVKCTNQGAGWWCYHRSLGNDYAIRMDSTAAKTNAANYWNDTTPTSTEFTLGDYGDTNGSGKTFVAYIFAHDDQSFGTSSDEAIIKCGGYTGSGSTGLSINVGFEPQFVILKRTDSTSDWLILDSMRGVTRGSDDDIILTANQTANEATSKFNAMSFNTTGFTLDSSVGSVNGNGGTYVYIAIRRPHKPLTAGTEVFDIDTFAGSGSAPVLDTGFPVDLTYTGWRDRNYVAAIVDRKDQTERYPTTGGGFNSTSTGIKFDLMDSVGITSYAGDTGYNVVNYSFRRAPGFFDIASFTPTSTNAALNVNHDLGVEPELMIVKQHGISDNWYVYHEHLGGTHTLKLNLADAASDVSNIWADTDPTASVFTVGTEFTDTFLFCRAYLFATLAGVSKVGTYSGTGNAINVDCGFTAGARFVMIKRSDSTGDWYVWDTARGIVSGNDEYLLVNENGLSVTTNTDYIDPLNSGFTVTSSAPAALNASGGTYIFFAIA